MSNYRVQQVLALGELHGRKLRLLIGLATFMDDSTQCVRVGFDALTIVTGNVRNTVRVARRELEAAGQLTSDPGNGRGHLTLWTVLCLPEKGVSVIAPVSDAVKGGNQPPERGAISLDKGGQPQRADLQEPVYGLNRLSKPSVSRASANGAAPRAEVQTRDQPLALTELCGRCGGYGHQRWDCPL